MSVNQQRSDRRKLRAGMVFVLVLAGTALIGWGGLAAWQAVTQNNGSTASTLGVHMQNAAAVTGAINPVTCTDLTSPGACGVVFDASGIKPGYGPTQVGTVAITNIGSEASTFQLSLQSAVVSGDDGNWTAADNTLCADLKLTVTDSTGHNVYVGSLCGDAEREHHGQRQQRGLEPGGHRHLLLQPRAPRHREHRRGLHLHRDLHLGPERGLIRHRRS